MIHREIERRLSVVGVRKFRIGSTENRSASTLRGICVAVVQSQGPRTGGGSRAVDDLNLGSATQLGTLGPTGFACEGRPWKRAASWRKGQAGVGDRIVVKGHHKEEPVRDGEILEGCNPDGSPPYMVRWSDSDPDALYFPGRDVAVQHFDHPVRG